MRAGELGGGGAPHPPNTHIHTDVVQQLEEPGEPDSRLPIFSFAVNGTLFVLYIYTHPQREPALSQPGGSP